MIERLILAIGLAGAIVFASLIVSVIGYGWSFAALVLVFSLMPLNGERS